MRITNSYNINKRPSFGAFRMTSPAKKKVRDIVNIISPMSALRLNTDIANAEFMFQKFKKDDLALYIKEGKLSVSYFMRDGSKDPYASARLDIVDDEHVNRFAREVRKYTEYAEFFDDGDAFFKKDVKREFV